MNLLIYLAYLWIFWEVKVEGSEVKDELFQATYIGDVARVEYLLNLDPSILSSRPPVLVNRRNEPFRRTSIMVCGLDPQKQSTEVDTDCAKIVHLIHKKGGNISSVDTMGWDALSLASFRGFNKLTSYIVKTKQVDINRCDNEGKTPLMKAAANGYFSTYKILLRQGSNSRLADSYGRRALHFATLFAIRDHIIGLQHLKNILLLHNDTNLLNLGDHDGRSILMYATIANDVEVCKIILGHFDTLQDLGSSAVEQVDRFGKSAAELSTSEVVKELLQNWQVDFVLRQHKKWLSQQNQLIDPFGEFVTMRITEEEKHESNGELDFE